MSDERGEMAPQAFDELASAYLDGEATAEEVALLEGNPGLRAQVEEFRVVRDLVSAPVEAPTDENRSQMIVQALNYRASVASLEGFRSRLRDIPSQAKVVLATAAVVAALAILGVALYEQAAQNGQDQLADDSAPAPAMAEAPTEAGPEALPAPVAESERNEAAEEPPLGGDAEPQRFEPAESALAEPQRFEADEEAVAEPGGAADSDEATGAEVPAREIMEADTVVQAGEAPMDESGAVDEPAEPMPHTHSRPESTAISGASPLLFKSAADLEAFARQIAENQGDPQGMDQFEEAAAIDLLGCPELPEEEFVLLARFEAVVIETTYLVSVYLTESALHLIETTPAPECGQLGFHTFPN